MPANLELRHLMVYVGQLFKLPSNVKSRPIAKATTHDPGSGIMLYCRIGISRVDGQRCHTYGAVVTISVTSAQDISPDTTID